MLLSKDNFQCNSLLVLALLTYLFIAVYVRELHLVIVRAAISSLIAFYSLKPRCPTLWLFGILLFLSCIFILFSVSLALLRKRCLVWPSCVFNSSCSPLANHLPRSIFPSVLGLSNAYTRTGLSCYHFSAPVNPNGPHLLLCPLDPLLSLCLSSFPLLVQGHTHLGV